MATQASIDQVQKIYIAYYGRPADPAGLEAWANALDDAGGDLSAIIDAFGTSPEAEARFGGLSSEETITTLYNQLFDRDPESQEIIDAWVDQLENNPAVTAQTIALDLLNGAKGQDAEVIANKFAVADRFTAAVDTEEGIAGYAGPSAVAYGVALLEPVDSSTNAEIYDVHTTVNALISPEGVFTLTENTVTTVTPAVDGEILTKMVTYWGFNPHSNDETDVDNLDGNDPSGNDNNLTNEGVSDGGVPASELLAYLGGLTGTDAGDADLLSLLSKFGIVDVIDDSGTTSLGQDNFNLGSVTNIGYVAGTDGDATGTLSVSYENDAGEIAQAEVQLGEYMHNLISDLIFDEEGNSRLFEVEVPVTSYWLEVSGDGINLATTTVSGVVGNVYVDAEGNPIEIPVVYGATDESSETSAHIPAILTTTVNNGGTEEEGYTTGANNTIVAARLDLLHGAYIDAGAGENTLEIDAKGYFAQPKELLNIQHISVENLPNIYTEVTTNGSGDWTDVDNGYPDLYFGDAVSGSEDSIIDISRAMDLETLTVSESDFDNLDTTLTDAGDLTIAGIRNGATVTLDGNFDSDTVSLHFRETADEGVNLVLHNVNMDETTLNLAHNAPVLNIESAGASNVIEDVDLGNINANLTHLNISGDAPLYIGQRDSSNGDIADAFAEEADVIIDASENTGGVSITFGEDSEFSGSLAFLGTEADDYLFADVNRAVTVTAGEGNDEYDIISNSDIVITAGDGNNSIEAAASGDGELENEGTVTVTVGDGQNDIYVSSTDAYTITAGDGDNRIEASGDFESGVTDADVHTIVVGEGQNEIDATGGLLSITTGNGDNEIDVTSSSLSITTGTGNDVIEATASGSGDQDATINAGEGNNTITVEGFEEVTVNVGAGDDALTIVGGDRDFASGTAISGDANFGSGSDLSGENGNETLITVDLGAGTNTLTLGADSGTNQSAITAIDGSTIAGENITLVVQTEADLTRADISGVTAVQMGNGDELTLTVSQFIAMGGSTSFSVIGESFNAQSNLNLVVDAAAVGADGSISLDELDIESLPRSIDLSFEITDGVQLELTAQQLHERVINEGINLYTDSNTDFQSGTVLITDAGLDFDPFNNNDQVRTSDAGANYLGGSLGSDFGADTDTIPDGVQRDEWGSNVLVDRVLNGYDRPVDAPSYSRLTIDTDTAGGSIGPFETIETFLRIVGDSDLEFVPVEGGIDDWGRPIPNAGSAIELASDTDGFLVDFSSVTGAVTNLTLGSFEKADGVYGNGDSNYVRVNVEINEEDGLATDVGEVGSLVQGLVSDGVQEYVVVDIDQHASGSGDVDFYTCETTKDLEVLGLQGNYGKTVNFLNTERGVEFLMEVAYDKGDGYVVGNILAEFARDDADAVVNVVGLNTLPAGEVQMVGNIATNNAETLTVNVTGGDTVIAALDTDTATSPTSAPGNSGGDATEVTLTADADLTITATLDDDVTSIDAAGVAGDLTVASAVDVPAGATDVDFTFVGAAGSTELTLTSSVTFSEDSSFTSAGDLTVVVDGATSTVDFTAADVTGIDALEIASGDSATLTIDQGYEIGGANISGEGSLTLIDLGEQPFSLADFDVTIASTTIRVVEADVVTLNPATDLTDVAVLQVVEGTTLNMTAAQYQQLDGTGTITVVDGSDAGTTVDLTTVTINITDLMQSDVEAGLDFTSVNAGTVTVTLAESVTIPADDGATNDVQTNLTNVDQWTVGDDMKLSAPEVSEFNGVDVIGGTNSTLEFTDTDNNGPSTPDTIDASGFDVDVLRVDEAYVAGQNIDELFQGLVERVSKAIFDQNGDVTAQDQTVTVEAGVTVGGSLEINRIEDDVEIQDLVLNLNGGSIIDGALILDSTDKNDGSDLLHAHLQSVTINSTGTEANEFSGTTQNIITGAITGAGSSAATQNNVLDITINADQVLDLQGGIVFTSAAGDDAFTLGDDTAAAATVTVNGTADVNLGAVNTTDTDVDSLTVNNAGTGSVSVTLTDANVEVADTDGTFDALAFTGSNINLLVTAATDVDLSDDDLSGVASITVGETDTDVAGSVTLTQAQYDATSVVNGTDDGAVATLNLVEFGAAPFDAPASGMDAIVITMAEGDITLDPATDLTGVTSINVIEGSTLNLTAAQFQQLAGTGTINVIDGSDAGTTAGDTGITVNITDLTQSDIWVDADGDGEQDAGEGFDLSGITVGTDGKITVTQSAAEATITLGSFDNEGLTTQALDLDVSSNLAGAEYIMGDNQTLELVDSTQADGLDVTGGADSSVVFRFDTLDPAQVTTSVPSIDVSAYDVTQLHTLNTMYNTANAALDGEQNVEVILANLPSAVELVITSDPLALGLVSARNRMVTIEEGVDVNGELVFNDIQQTVELTTLTIDFEGDASIMGDLRIPTVDEGVNLQAANFGTLTINSNGTSTNSITGDITAVAAGPVPTTATEQENSLLNVVINATSDFEIGTYAASDGEHTSGGDIIFTALEDSAVANLTIEGTGNVKMHGIDATDDDNNGTTPNVGDIGTVNIVNNAGTLTMTGGTAAISGDGVETINISGTGDVVLGNNDAITGGSASEGVDSDTLSTIDASGLTGDLDLGELSDIDSLDFTFTSGTGVTTLELDDTAFGDATNDLANSWSFDFSNAAAGSEMTIGSTITFANALTDAETSNALTIDMGANQLCIAANQDFTPLETLSITGTIVLKAGVDITLTAAQASGLNIIVDPSVITDADDDDFVLGDVPTVTITDLGTAEYDFTNILAGVPADAEAPVFTATLAENDVTLNENTVLGDVTIILDDLVDATTAANDELEGQTIRFNTQEQAERDIDVTNPGSGGANESSINVIWLMDPADITAPINTDAYDANITRVWFKEALADGANVEDLFTSLPDSILRVDFADLTDLASLLSSDAVNRVVELASFTSLPGGLTFNDGDFDEHLETLDIRMGGQVTTGDIVIDNIIDLGGTYDSDPAFTGVTLTSVLADDTGDLLAREGFDESENVKPNSVNTVGDIRVGTDNNFDLLNVTLNTGADEDTNDVSTSNESDANIVALAALYASINALTWATSDVATEAAQAALTTAAVTAGTITAAQKTAIDTAFDANLTAGDGSDLATAQAAAIAAGPSADVDVLTGTDLVVGDIEFDSEDEANDVATLTLQGANDITVASIDTDGIVNFSMDVGFFTGTLDPVMHLDGTNAWTMTDGEDGIGGAGDGNPATHIFTEVEGDELSIVNFSDTDDNITITFSEIDSNDDDLNNDGDAVDTLSEVDDGVDYNGDGDMEDTGITENLAFTYTASTGINNVTLDAVGANAPTLEADSTWTFNMAGAAAGSTLTIGDGVTLEPGSNLTINLGDDTTLVIDDSVDLTGVNLTITGNGGVLIPAGQTLTLTPAQVVAIPGNIYGEGTLIVDGNADDLAADWADNVRTYNVDLSQVDLTAADGADNVATTDDQLDTTLTAAGPLDDDGNAPADDTGYTVTGSGNVDVVIGSNLDDSFTLGAGDDTATGGTGDDTFNVDAGTDTITDLTGDAVDGGADDDALVVSAGATADVTTVGFVATAETSNAGTATITAADDATVDMTNASGPNGYTVVGSSADNSANTLIGSAFADTINGGDSAANDADDVDTLSGNAGGDTFQFNVNMGNTTSLALNTTQVNVDREEIQVTGVDSAAGSGDESLAVNYTINGAALSVTVDLSATDVESASAIAAAIASELQTNGSFISQAIVDPGDNTNVIVTAQTGYDLEITGFAAETGFTANPTAAVSEGVDVAQVVELTATGNPTTDDIYSVLATLNGGASIAGQHTAIGGDEADEVVDGIGGDFNANAGGTTIDVTDIDADGVVIFTDENADNGGFTLITDVTAAFGGSGASNNAGDHTTADIITDFVSGTDKVEFVTATDTNLGTGSGANYLEAAEVADETAADAAATTAFGNNAGTLQYYFTSVADIDGNAAADFDSDGDNADQFGMLYFDANLDGNIDGVILLTGIDSDNFSAFDIIAS
ncbi:DUF4214 domain-containing protein [Neptuniibacter sp.]|uniref:DUF4214 domain-containing protein n=1 Tax=Neptuniibacter sp. TaxID=1962643 RepID=UPI002606A795|nr:DUF4214 domain-containing protein [Neptuniibacter sp.]MCP4598623.1 DUF4214 domain-containing protein [Neptuniibacter sp.]